MSKKKVELMPSDSSIKPIVSYARIREVREDCVIVVDITGAAQLIPLYRFLKEDDIDNLSVGAEVKINHYFSNPPKPTKRKHLAYNAELTSE